MSYIVMIQVEKGEYLEVTGKNVFSKDDPAKIFKTKAEAEREAAKWNTGIVVPVVGG